MFLNIITKPSYYALVLTGFLILLCVVIIILNIKKTKTKSPEILITLISLFGVLIGVHGLLHLGLETVYNFNPLETVLYRTT